MLVCFITWDKTSIISIIIIIGVVSPVNEGIFL